MLFYVQTERPCGLLCCFMSTETIRTIRDGEFVHTSVLHYVQTERPCGLLCCFMSTETVRTIRDCSFSAALRPD